MSEYASAHFIKGVKGYWTTKLQATGALVTPTTVADPAAQTGVTTRVGVGPVAAWEGSENAQPLEAAGSYTDLAEIGRRREVGCRAQLSLVNGAFLANAIRDVTSLTYTRKGLPLFTTEVGFVGTGGYTVQLIDTLLNSVTFNASEGQYLTAEAEMLAITAITGGAAAIPAVTVPTDVLKWRELSVTAETQGGDDLMPLLQSVRVTVNNNCERIGMRPQYFSGQNELAISRTPMTILPHMEKVQVSYTLRGRSPVATNLDWGTVTLLATNGAVSPQVCRIVIDHHYASRQAMNQTGPNDVMTYTVDAPAFGIGIYDTLDVA